MPHIRRVGEGAKAGEKSRAWFGGSAHTSTGLSMSGGLDQWQCGNPGFASPFPPILGGREALQGEAGGRAVRWLRSCFDEAQHERRAVSGETSITPFDSTFGIRHSAFAISSLSLFGIPQHCSRFGTEVIWFCWEHFRLDGCSYCCNQLPQAPTHIFPQRQ